MTAELSIVVPTFNERHNVSQLYAALARALEGIDWEVIFVDDDSPDGTSDLIRRIAHEDPRVRCIQRINRRGLSSACVEGMMATAAPYIAVMDADLQHDDRMLPAMLNVLRNSDNEIVIGSRYIEGGGLGDWARSRVRISALATAISRRLTRTPLSDPMSGFFMLRRSLLERSVRRMSQTGFKVLFDLFLSADGPVRFAELPYRMQPRARGESKLEFQVVWEFFVLLAEKLIGRVIPIRFVMFVMIGALGAVLHLTVLGLLFRLLSTSFVIGQAAATLLAMTLNFTLNNLFTYRDRRLRGLGLAWGLFSFYLICSVGAFVNIVVATFLYERGIPWWFSGLLGAIIGAVWNFAVSATFTWHRRPAGSGRRA